jgi:D-beta-D-heptose 7-phosphate kinase/D-beta-D-heptose 1-phosphate adenosyltransferase
MKIVLVTGGFDPLHSGHIKYLKTAKSLGDKLVVGINSDAWLTRKKGRPFMPIIERTSVIRELSCVDEIVAFDDSYDADGSAKRFIQDALNLYLTDEIIFANGGDRNQDNIPEMSIQDNRLSFAFGIGGEDKANSSSWILEEWKSPKTLRQWGYYRVLHEQGKEVKVKELVVEPGKHLSMQKHSERAELWFVAEGVATVGTINPRNTDYVIRGVYYKDATISISGNEWHQLMNNTTEPLKIIEIQFGSNCVEDDIERK